MFSKLVSVARPAVARGLRTAGVGAVSRFVPVSGVAAQQTVAHFPAMWTTTQQRFTTAQSGNDMFCFQCEQTASGTGCTVVGVCGKDPTTAAMQDLLLHALKGMAEWAHAAREIGAPENPAANEHTLKAMFSTLTNVNFDAERFCDFIAQTVEYREERKAAYEAAGGTAPSTLSGAASWTPASGSFTDVDSLAAEGRALGVEAANSTYGDDINGLRELVVYGLKGAAAYAAHAHEVGSVATDTINFAHKALAALAQGENTVDGLLGLALSTGEANLAALTALDSGHTQRYGHPVPTPVNHSPVEGKCILVSGHDMRDLEALLQQTEGKGINVYTHGEMLPAHGYPGLKEKYPHLVGNYGAAWQLQKFEFNKFPGPIVITTNCLVEPRKSYADRIYTCGVTGFPGTQHIGDRDFSKVIDQALSMEGFKATKAPKEILTGFGHNAVLGVADQVIEAATEGKLKQLVLIGGCDGSEGERSYYTKLGKALPDESMILTLGCGKYRLIGRQDYGNVPGTQLPRLIDMGQCNDSYSAVVVALELAKALDTDVNSLPLSIALSWFEQKAVAVLLTLLHLGVKDIHIGPNLPAFITPPVLNQLVEAFNLVPIGDPKQAEADAAKFMQHNNA